MDPMLSSSGPLASEAALACMPGPCPASELWLAACVRSRHEKKVAQQLESHALQCFLPLYESVHRWKDRRATVSLPLFPGYVFARIAPAERMRILTTPGVVKLVTFQGQPAAIPDAEIDSLRHLCANEARMEPHPYLKIGRRVRINSGPFAGTEGVLLRRKGRFRFVLSLDLIARSVAMEIDDCDVSPVFEPPSRTGRRGPLASS
jgi:transcription termination/antitermination protein NusG